MDPINLSGRIMVKRRGSAFWGWEFWGWECRKQEFGDEGYGDKVSEG